MASTKIIDGKRYTYAGFATTRREAKVTAEGIRKKHGCKVRVLKAGGEARRYGWYNLWEHC